MGPKRATREVKKMSHVATASMVAQAWSASYGRWDFLLVACSVMILVLVQSHAEALSSDGSILLQFQKHVTYSKEGPGTQLNWMASDDHPCSWLGVKCTSDNKVRELSLSFLSGNVTGALGSLAALQNLDTLHLVQGNLTGFIPESVGNLKSLKELDLAHNLITGPIPIEITSRLPRLRLLNLSSNALNGTVPSLQSLSNLCCLNLSRNGLTGSIPPLQGLVNLQSLDLAGNSFSGTIPDLKRLVRLEVLDFSRNRLSGGIPDPVGLENLTKLMLTGNELTGPIPLQLRGSRCEEIDLSGNHLSGVIPPQLLEPGTVLRVLKLSGNELTGMIPVYNISDRGSTPGVPARQEDPGWRHLEVLDLSSNQMVGPIPWWMFEGLLMPRLMKLCLQNNQLSGNIGYHEECRGGSHYCDLPQGLTELRLGMNNISGYIDIQRTYSRFYGLEVLDLGYNPLRVTIPRSQQKMFWQPDFNIVLYTLFGLYASTLKELRLGGLHLAGPLTAIKTPLSRLEVLDLSHNQLEGHIPAEYKTELLPRLLFLDMSHNQLTGEVPPAFLGMRNCLYLNVDNDTGLCSAPLPPPNICATPPHALYCARAEALPACPETGLPLHLISAVSVLVAVVISIGSCLILAWCWRRYAKLHRQDADLIAALQNRENATLMSLRVLRKATSNFSASFQIGAGGFGTVYTGRLNDGTVVAIKRSRHEASDKYKEQFLNEVKILSQVHHRHLVRLLGCCLENKVAVLVFEYVSNGTLLQHLKGQRGEPLSWCQRLQVAFQTADALSYLHSAANPSIFHRDVKSSNILLDENLNAKVADFGISRLATLEATHVSTKVVQGTIGYIDPEYYQSFQLTGKSDVYSFGVVLLELLSAQAAVDMTRGYEDASLVNMALPLITTGQLQVLLDPAIAAAYGFAEDKASMDSVANLAVACLSFRARDRPSMKEVVQELQSLCPQPQCPPWEIAPEEGTPSSSWSDYPSSTASSNTCTDTVSK